ncbi:MAG TPA: redoxin domain-containing protein [Solirubrobacterales bacterium]|jgi:peroxiredoxin Q/BCP|nr:redoxin domain-containing protein [Solirubrobacterales bacterium]
MLEAGEAAPDFTLPDQDGAELTLSELRGQTVVLYFYPRADTMSYNCSNGSASSHRHHPSL